MSTHTLEITSFVNHDGNLELYTEMSDMEGEPDCADFDLSENVMFMLRHVARNVAAQWNNSPQLINVFEDWQNGSTSFDSQVLSLIQHADSENRKLLSAIYPVHVSLFENLYHGSRGQVH